MQVTLPDHALRMLPNERGAIAPGTLSQRTSPKFDLRQASRTEVVEGTEDGQAWRARKLPWHAPATSRRNLSSRDGASNTRNRGEENIPELRVCSSDDPLLTVNDPTQCSHNMCSGNLLADFETPLTELLAHIDPLTLRFAQLFPEYMYIVTIRHGDALLF